MLRPRSIMGVEAELEAHLGILRGVVLDGWESLLAQRKSNATQILAAALDSSVARLGRERLGELLPDT